VKAILSPMLASKFNYNLSAWLLNSLVLGRDYSIKKRKLITVTHISKGKQLCQNGYG